MGDFSEEKRGHINNDQLKGLETTGAVVHQGYMMDLEDNLKDPMDIRKLYPT